MERERRIIDVMERETTGGVLDVLAISVLSERKTIVAVQLLCSMFET